MCDPKVIRITVLMMLIVGSIVDAKPFSKHGRREHKFANKPVLMWFPITATRPSTPADDPLTTTEATTVANTVVTRPFVEPVWTTKTQEVASTAASPNSTRPSYFTRAPAQPSTESVTIARPEKTASTDWPTTSGPLTTAKPTARTTTTTSNITMTPVGPRARVVSTAAPEVTQNPLSTIWTWMTTAASTAAPADDSTSGESIELARSTTLVATTPEDEPTRINSDIVETSSAVTEPSATTETPESDEDQPVDKSVENVENTTHSELSITIDASKPVDRFKETMAKAMEVFFSDSEITTDSNKPLVTTQQPAVRTEEFTTTPSIETVTVIDFTTKPPTEEATDAIKHELRQTLEPHINQVPPETAGKWEKKLEMAMQLLKDASDAVDDFYRQVGQQVNTLDEKINQYIARPKAWKNCIQRPVDARKWLSADMLELFCDNGQFLTRIELRRGPLGNLSVECCTLE